MKTEMQKLKASFYIKADKENNDGLAMIYCKAEINDTTCTFSTGYMAEPEKWRKLKQFRLSRNEHEIKIRNEINQLYVNMDKAVKAAEVNNIELTALDLKKEALNPGSVELKKKDYSLLEAFKLHHDQFEVKVKAESRSSSTLSKFNTTKSHNINYLKLKYEKPDILLKDLNFDYINGYHWHMRTVADCSHNYAVRRCEFLKSVVKLARKMEWIEKDPFMLYSEKRLPVETVYLTKEELEKLNTVKLTSEKHEVVRDLFFFTVYSGYAGADVAKLTPDHVVKHTDGKNWIFTSGQKTKIESNVPLLSPARALIEKYKNDNYCIMKGKLFPKRSNQKINKYLKEIAELAGIKKRLYYYVARHTFATTICLANGVSLEALSKMMGHKRITQTQHYAKILNTMVSAEMKMLDDKLFSEK